MFRRMQQLAPALVTIPAGEFLMGSTQAQAEAAAVQFGLPLAWCLVETPQHTVALGEFQISRGPVTCAEYLAFIVATDHPRPSYWGGDEPPAALADHPVVEISFNDARAYCRWLSTATDLCFRLPTEAEWEKAARSHDGRIFPWGDQWDSTFCNTAEGGPGTTTPVGSYPHDTSPYGCVDMAGNVEEWTLSRYKPYPGNTLAVPSEKSIVVRGGCWNSSGDLARCARRHGLYELPTRRALGFRIVCVDE